MIQDEGSLLLSNQQHMKENMHNISKGKEKSLWMISKREVPWAYTVEKATLRTSLVTNQSVQLLS